MRLEGEPGIVASYGRVMYLSEIGEHALLQFPDKTLKIVAIASGATLYDASSTTISINVAELGTHPAEEQCATLCHETFHFFHDMLDPPNFRRRNTLSSRDFDTEEEELTITGTCPSVRDDAWDHSLFNENAVLRDRGLPERTSHLSREEEEERKSGERPTVVSTVVEIPMAQPRGQIPAHVMARLQRKTSAKRTGTHE